MRSKRWVAAAVAATALAAVPLATAGMMHPELGARLSGMGETGVVNLTAHSQTHRLCWKFQLHVMHVLGATVRDRHGMIVARLGHMYRAKGCAMVPKMSLRLIEEKPGRYRVWVATKGHPGDLRGRLFAGMAHM
jgi:trehalose utilization protein